ncbi:lysophospholipid acyltransferase family protein [Novosphingobium tardum]|uniref:Lysophospholipid acyltransferase family protein n=1 Tax=Novosphingobium tardum TaxID=1538021 RepID=A0ABV8RJQ9_9SPHN
MAVLRSLAFYLCFYVGSIPFVVIAALAIGFSPRAMRRTVRLWAMFHRACARYILGIRLVIEGRPSNQPMLYAVKHESFYEAIDMPALFDLPVVFAKAELMDIPLWGRAAAAFGVVAVEREAGAKALRAMVAAAKRFSASGRPLVIFPEGTRVPHGAPAPLQAGFAGLYKLIGLPVVPVAVDTGPLYHRRWKRAGIVTYRFGEPIPPGLPREEIQDRVLAAINALNG